VKRPAVSILLPFRDAAATLDETLESIAAQSFTDYEVVAVDDGSRDDSAARVAERARRDPRLRLFRTPHRGQVEAMNFGLARARAPLVARMDADDRMHPERLARQHACLASEPRLSLVGSRIRLFPERAITDGFREYIRWQNGCLTPEEIAANIYVELPIAHPSMMYRRQAILDAGGYRDGEFPEDYELLLRLHRQGHRMAKLPQVLLEWRESSGRLTRTDPRLSRTAFDRIRAAYLARDPRLTAGRPLAFWGAGRNTRKRVTHLLQHGFQPGVWVDIDPRKIGNIVDGARVVGPDWLRRKEKPFVLSYVANHGAREEIAAWLETMAYRRGTDYLIVG